MKKLALLLDDITIINFGLLYKLGIRYYMHLLVAVVVFLFLFFKYYYTQPIIFSSSMPMKVTMKQQTMSGDNATAGRLDGTPIITIGELNASFGSFAFHKTFASFVVKDKEFMNMDFGSIATGQHVSGSSISKSCNGKNDCIIDTVAGYIGGLFSLEQGLTEDRFNVTVNSLNGETSLRLKEALVKAIEKNRIEVRRYAIGKEIESVNNLISETRGYLHKQNGFQKIEDEEKNASIISDLKERMRILQTSLSNEIANSSALEARLSENKNVLNEMEKTSDGINRIQHKEVEKRILDIKNNILAITNVREDRRTDSDKLILAQLQAELEELEGTHKGSENLRTLTLKDNFSDEQRAKENDFRFDYVVSKNKIANIQADYETIKTQLDSYQKDKTSRESMLSQLKAEVEFLKNLESKQLSLKVTNSTLTSDLQFEDFSNSVGSFRRSSSVKISLFSFCLTLIVYLCTLVFRYLIDNRIYTEDDVMLYLDKLEFYGEVPTFE